MAGPAPVKASWPDNPGLKQKLDRRPLGSN
jgi:hypothetical protein